jgi:4-amino-4-deoxy-L-arabinose transferase-like glycosyltransferase
MTSGVDPQPVPALARLPVFGIAGAVVVLLLALSGRYGYLGDELYFVVAGRHLSWGYADQPPLLPLLAVTANTIAPGSLFLLRLPGALVTGAGIVVAALTARELGGERRAQWQTAAAYAVSLQLLASGHFLATSTLDPFLWTVIGWLVVRWVRTRRDGLLVWAGLVTGIDMQVKYLIPLLWLALLVSVLVVGPRALLRRPLLWVGFAIAVVITVPSLLWQATHGWPQLAVTKQINGDVAASGGRLALIPMAVYTAGILVGAVLLCYGLWQLLRAPELRAYRFLGWTVVGVTVLCIATEGRYYYVAGLYSLCWAAATVRMQQRTPHAWWRWLATWPSYAVSAVIAITAGLPVLPAASYGQTLTVAGSVGWSEFSQDVADTYHSLPAEHRADTAIVATTYWQASAIDFYGPRQGLPAAYSPNRGFWFFGQPPASATDMLFIGASSLGLNKYCTSLRPVSAVNIENGADGQQHGVSIWDCTGLRTTWTQIWQTYHVV